MNWVTIKNPLFASGPDDEFAKFHFDFTNNSPPKHLFHYTSEENLINIIKFGNLWATECTFLNDASELRAGISVFEEELLLFDDNIFVELIKSALIRWDDNSWMHFVVSLSEQGDILSQWRAYGNDGKGCSIALDATCIKNRAGFGEHVRIDPEMLPKETSNFYHLLKVVYDINRKQEIARQFLMHAKKEFDNLRVADLTTSDEDREGFILLVAIRLKEFLISFKNTEFSEEREWRVVSSLHSNDLCIDFRNTNYGLSPYTKINLSPRDQIMSSRLPIERIILGPRNKTKPNQKGLDLLLKRMGCDAEIVPSMISYR